MTIIEIPDEQAEALKAKAAEQGLTLQAWLKSVADESKSRELPPPALATSTKSIAEIIVDRMKNVPPEAWGDRRRDGASQHDHYLYGWPKREE